MRVQGQLGDVAIDLQISLEESEWARLAELLREAGACEGPQLLADLQALAGSAEAGKRLLVRLRHSPQVRVEQQDEAPLYIWLGDQPAP